MSELPPLDDDLRALVVEERESYAFDDVRAARLLRRVETRVALGAGIEAPIATPSQHPAGISPRRVVTGVVVAFALGVGVGNAMSSRDVAPPSSTRLEDASVPVQVAPLTDGGPTIDADADTASDAALAAPVVSSAPSPSSTAPSASSSATSLRPSSLAEEQALVDRARAALARGRGHDALAATSEHAKLFPRGRLAEEREMLAIQALVATGDRDKARAAADRFARAYPKSVFLPSVEKVVGK